MSAASILLGAVLTFGTSDGRTLQLTVSTTKAATCALAWGDLVQSATVARSRHVFRGLPVPGARAVQYVLRLGGEAPRRVMVGPIGDGGVVRFVVYGDSRDGTAPHKHIVESIARRDLDVVVHTGDVVRSGDDAQGWVHHLSNSLPLSSKVPIILSLGNHELYNAGMPMEMDTLTKAMTEIPPPVDPIARALGAPIAAFHVRVGPALFISLDSNSPLGPGTPQYAFLERVLSEERAQFVFVSYHHGPLSSGPHGGHVHGSAIVALLEKYGATASLAGHDHVYERIVREGITYVISGGGGAPLYMQSRTVAGSRAFASTYNWVEIVADGGSGRVDLEAFSLEGATLDRAAIRPVPEDHPGGVVAPGDRRFVFSSVLVLALAIAFVAARLLVRRA